MLAIVFPVAMILVGKALEWWPLDATLEGTGGFWELLGIANDGDAKFCGSFDKVFAAPCQRFLRSGSEQALRPAVLIEESLSRPHDPPQRP